MQVSAVFKAFHPGKSGMMMELSEAHHRKTEVNP
jgi:hypothetical protein